LDSSTYVAAKNAAALADVASSARVAQTDAISGAILPPDPIDSLASIAPFATHRPWHNIVSDIALVATSVESEIVARHVAGVNVARVNQVLSLQSDDNTGLAVWNENDGADDLTNVFDNSWAAGLGGSGVVRRVNRVVAARN
jgi:hypothetical protein